jgi:hypothetical protein
VKKLGLLLLSSTCVLAGTLETSKETQFLGGQVSRNYIRNPGAEKNVSNVTIGATMSVTRTTTTVIEGDAEFTVDGAATSDTADFTTDTFQLGLSGQNCVASFTYDGDASLYTARARIGSSNVASLALSNVASGTQRVNINFPCGDGASAMVLRIENTGAAGAAFRMDSLYVGLATNLTQVAQATEFGTATHAATLNCQWTTTSTTLVNFAADADCPAATVTGEASTPGTRIPGITFASLPAGNYQLVATGYFGPIATSPNAEMRFVLSDGTSIAGVANGNQQGTSAFSSSSQITGRFSYTAPQSNITFQVQARTSNASNSATIVNDTTSVVAIPLRFVLYRFPTSTELAVRSDLSAWKVDATIGGSNPTPSNVTVASYTGIFDGSLDLINNAGTQNIAAQIPCSSTNAPTGLTCSSGTESVGVAFTPTGSFPQDVLACASFGWAAATLAGSFVTTLQIVETPTNAQTISQEGKSRITVGNEVANTTVDLPLRVCGNFTFASPGQRVLRLMFEQVVAGVVSNSVIWGDRSASNGQRDIHWEVYPLNQAQPAPILVNSITSNTTGAERIERAVINVTGASTCSITSQTGTWVSSVSAASSACTLTLASGIFSATPTCVGSVNATGVGAVFTAVEGVSSTSVIVRSFNDTGVAVNQPANIHCMGPR